MDLSDPDRFLEETNILWLVVSRHKDYKPTSHNQFSTWSYILITQSFWRVFFQLHGVNSKHSKVFISVFFFLMFFWCLVKSWADFFWWKTLLRSTRWGFFSNQTSPPQNGKKIGQIRVGEICSNSLILNPRNVTCTQELDISHMKNKLVMKLAIGNSFFLSESSKLVK